MKADPELTAQFQDLLDAYGPAVRRLCTVYAWDWTDEQDLFQEIALALWTALPSFRGDSSVRTWIYRIAHNVATTTSIRLGRSRTHEVQSDELPSVRLGLNERREQLLDAVRRLRSVDQELIVLYLEGLSTREISAVLGITEKNTTVRLSRVRQRLADMLLAATETNR